ncbi:MAG: hypothetical protein H8D72_01570, partial [Planctomycetes bacterium]|nr:hypothetical protein [Planctomycetota bacterium]
MISNRRTTAPILWIAFATLLLLARQGFVQIAEHQIWSEEAARLERSGEVIPYRRGSIEDAMGRVVVRDVEAYHLDFAYRDFRRGHPLAMVAHAASVLLLEPVPLTLALDHAPDWALHFVALTPGELRDFAAGAGLQMGPLAGLPATGSRLAVAADRDERRALDLARRSGDIGFYIGRLLQLSRSEAKWLLRASEDADRVDVPFVQLIAKYRKVAVSDLRRDVYDHVTKSLEDLDLLAQRMRFGVEDTAAFGTQVRRPAVALAAELEAWRRGIEDAAASRLFREATGFVPGRLEPGTLLKYFELDWISVYLRWNPERLVQWAVASRRNFLGGYRDAVVLPQMMASLRSGPPPTAREVALVLSALWYTGTDLASVLDDERGPLERREGLEVTGRLATVFLADMGPELASDDPRLPWVQLASLDPETDVGQALGDELELAWRQASAAQGSRGRVGGSAHEAVEAALQAAEDAGNATSRAERWEWHFKTPDSRSRALLSGLAAELADAWEVRWQDLLSSLFETARAAADA